jgi:hypothetical protein
VATSNYDPDTEHRVKASRSEFGLLAETQMSNMHLTQDAIMTARGYRRKEGGGWEVIPEEDL